MKTALNNVNSWVGGIVGLLKTVIVFFVFVNILYVTNVNPIGGIIELVDSFVNGGLAGSQELSSTEINFYSGTILSGAFAMSIGSAFASKYKKDNYITVAVIGDGGMEEGIVFETNNLRLGLNQYQCQQ